MSDKILQAVTSFSEQSDSVDDEIKRIELANFEKSRNEHLKEIINDIVHYRELRKEYAGKVFVFMCVWSGLMFLILIIKGFFKNNFDLDNTVLITLAGGTTVSVIGLVGFIIQGLFNSKK